MLYQPGVDSSGIEARSHVANIILQTGHKNKYNHAHEWCCGHGAMGFYLLQQQICHNVTLTDCRTDAIIGCSYTRAANSLEQSVKIHQIKKFLDIPVPSTKWDLVVSNPPYVPYLNYYTQQGLDTDQWGEIIKSMWIDQDWQLHIDFFSNLDKYIDQDCEIYLFGIQDFFEQQVAMANDYHFKFLGKYNIFPPESNMSNVLLLHFIRS